MKNSAFRLNGTAGMEIASNAGSVLIYNTLFADQTGTGLQSTGTTTLVNTTFANNGYGHDRKSGGVQLCVVAKMAVRNMPEESGNALLGNAVNDDLQNGPNL